VAGRAIPATGSIGIAMWPEDAPDGPALLRAADAALYRAKAAGRAGFAFSEPPAGAVE
jgi:GGDEF domain-containing protein